LAFADLIHRLKSARTRAASKAAHSSAERAQRSGDHQRFREMATLSCVLMIRSAGIQPNLETRPHPQEFADALAQLEGPDLTALIRAGGLYAVALAQAGDYGQCIGFGVPGLTTLQAMGDSAAMVAQLELLAALGSSYRALGDVDKAAHCNKAWDELQGEVLRLHPQPSWMLAFSSADSLWTGGSHIEAIAVLNAELKAHKARRGRQRRDASDWICLITAMRNTFVALHSGTTAEAVRAAIAEAVAAWHMRIASYDIAPELLLGRGSEIVDKGADPAEIRELAFLALVFARDVRNKQALRWRVLNALVPSARSSAEATLLCKLAVEEILSLQSDLSNIDETLGGTEEGKLARLFSGLVSRLIAEGRLAEASIVMNLRWQKEIMVNSAIERAGFSPNATLLVGEERAAAMIYYAARNSSEAPRAAALMVQMGDYIGAAVANAPDTESKALAAAQSQLAKGDALLQVMPGASETSVIVQTTNRMISRTVPVSSRQINDWVFRSLQKIEKRASMEQIPELAAIFTQVISPALSNFPDGELNRLIVASTGALQSLPWACLHDGQRWLIERYSVCRASTEAGSWSESPASPIRLFIGGTGKGIDGVVGDIDIFSELEGLRAIGKNAGEVRFAPEVEFTREALLAGLQTSTILSVSAHCFPDKLSPRQSRLMLGDGQTILLDDLAQVPVSCDLVVLSACETGRIGSSLIPGGDVAIDRLLCTSGVRSVVSTAWAVNNNSQTKLMLGFFEYLLAARLEKDVALAQVQRCMIAKAVRSNDPQEDWSHPYYWAAPMLTGNWQPFA
jgi:CHAT domain-containing protein